MNELKEIWRSAKGNTSHVNISIDRLIEKAELKRRKTLSAHYGNIGILTLVAIMIILCFRFFFPFQEALARTGIGLMIGGLIIRIGIEMFSIMKSKKIRISDTTAQATDDTIAFYQFRKKIHGPVTLIIVVLYIIGFYMLSPEFSKHMPVNALIIMDIGFLVGALLLAWVIRSGIRQELEDLQELVEIRKQLF